MAENAQTATTSITEAATVQQGPALAGNGVLDAANTGGNWFAGFDRETQGYLQNKGWTHAQGPAELVKAYRNLERFNGMDKLPLPRDENDAEGWNRTYDRLGRPARWQDYGIDVPEGANRDYADHMAEIFHRAGLSTRQAQLIAAENEKFVTALQAESDHQFATGSQAELDAVRREWGADADRRFAAAQRAGLAFGIERETMEKIERAVGTRSFLGLMSRIGEGLTEDRGAGTGSSGFMTPEAAQARLNDLKADRAWVRRYLNGDVGARADYDRLISIVAAG
jgi:hypothetical protein